MPLSAARDRAGARAAQIRSAAIITWPGTARRGRYFWPRASYVSRLSDRVRRIDWKADSLHTPSDRLMVDVGSTAFAASEDSSSQSNGCADDGTNECRWQPQFDHSEPSRWWIDPEPSDQPNEGAEHP